MLPRAACTAPPGDPHTWAHGFGLDVTITESISSKPPSLPISVKVYPPSRAHLPDRHLQSRPSPRRQQPRGSTSDHHRDPRRSGPRNYPRRRLPRQPPLRRLSAAELSDGTLRYLLLVAALLTPRPPELLVLNEPETSLHPELLPALARSYSPPPATPRSSSLPMRLFSSTSSPAPLSAPASTSSKTSAKPNSKNKPCSTNQSGSGLHARKGRPPSPAIPPPTRCHS
jgi:hypothetical protein